MQFPTVQHLSLLSHLLIPASLHNMPVQSQSLIYGFHLYCFPQIYSRSLPESPVFFPDNMLSPVVTDGTCGKNHGSPVEYRCMGWYHRVPVLPVHHRIHAPVPPRSSVLELPGSKAVLVCSSYQRAHCTIVSASHSLPDKFYTVFSFRSSSPLFRNFYRYFTVMIL